MPGNLLSDPAALGSLITVLVLLARGVAWYARNRLPDTIPVIPEEDRLARLERKLDALLARSSMAPLGKSTRDRMIVALGREGIDSDHITQVLGCSERVIGTVLRKAGVT